MIKKNKYLEGQIYKISSYSRPDLVYIGSTCKSLNQRLSGHLSSFNRFIKGKTKKCLSSFEIIKLGDYHIDLIEKFPCENRTQLLCRETYFIRTMVCVNNRVSYRTEEERKADDVRQCREYQKEYDKIIDTCECGYVYKRNYKSTHIKSRIHLNYLKSLEPATILPELTS